MGRISFTTDIWSDLNLRPFLACMAHWIGKGTSTPLLLKSALIAFHHPPGSHTGINISKALFDILERAGIMAKVSTDHQLDLFH